MMDLGPQRVDHGHKPGGLEQQTWIRAQSQTVKPRCGQAALPPKAAGEDPRWLRRFSRGSGCPLARGCVAPSFDSISTWPSSLSLFSSRLSHGHLPLGQGTLSSGEMSS